jgi:diaminohydroxyphosphoribosylaminopyrimidine deaminase/5-amino-6-(5-phosphoribosylamino)uracil reductase
MVGCVVVRDGELVSEGWHEQAGGPHAEAIALRAAGARAQGACVYVTLEPCSHIGRTPPCTEALVAAGVRRVVAALPDPNPLAAGGAAALAAAGVEVEVGVCAEEAARQNEVFLHGIAHGRPFVVLKAAVSVDGRMAAADGTSQWLTGPSARRRAHRLRAQVDAIVVGSGTVLADDPRLTVRLGEDHAAGHAPGEPPTRRAATRRPPPLRVILDARGRTPPGARVLDGAAPTLVCIGPGADPQALRSAGVEVATVPAANGGGVELGAVLALLWARGVRSVVVEGGGVLLSAFLRGHCFDRLVVHIAPLLLGSGGRPLLHGGPATLADVGRLRLDGVERADDDVLLTYTPIRSGGV